MAGARLGNALYQHVRVVYLDRNAIERNASPSVLLPEEAEIGWVGGAVSPELEWVRRIADDIELALVHVEHHGFQLLVPDDVAVRELR